MKSRKLFAALLCALLCLLMAGIALAEGEPYPESAHPYANNTDQSWTYTWPDSSAEYLKLTFSVDSKTESNFDFVYILDSQGVQQTKLSGSLAGKTVCVKGNSFTVRLTSDSSSTYYGFAFNSIAAISQDEYEASHSGTCGTNVTWKLSSDGTLTISGSGAMKDYSDSSSAPWYSYQTEVKNAVIESSVSDIGNYVFYDCSSLTSVTIPDGVTSIGSDAFSNCSSLTSIFIPSSVQTIYASSSTDSPFYGCSSSLIIWTDAEEKQPGWQDYWNYCSYSPRTVLFGTSRADYELWNSFDKSAENVVIPDGITVIPPKAFYCCSNMKSISIPDSVISIGDQAFFGCYNLTNIIIPDGVMSIPENAFYGCGNLISIMLPDSVTCIGQNAFGECSNLTSITIPDSVTSIGGNAFSCCRSLTSIVIPDSVTDIGDGAFSVCTSLMNISIPDGVTRIGFNMFSECSNLTNIIIPDSVTEIGAYAFCYCSNLTSISIPDSVTSIDASAFLYCSSLTNITIPNGVTEIGLGMFSGCSSLTSISLPNSVTSIGVEAFANCRSLKNITIPNSVTSINEYAFYGCSGLISISIPDSVTSIGDCAFAGCSGLTSIVIPNGVTRIGYYMFGECDNLTSITIPDSVTSIGNHAFSGCCSLSDIVIPRSVTSIEMTSVDGLILHCYDGSYAEEWANANGIEYIPEHISMTVEAVAPTCTKEGITEGEICDVCGAVLTGYEVIPALGHELIHHEAQVPDAAHIGWAAYDTCARCDYSTYEEIPALVGIVASGEYGENISWELDENGTLLINGSGEMPDYAPEKTPWHAYRESIHSVVIDSGITSIGQYAFYDCTLLTSIVIPDSVTGIGDFVFHNCSSLTSINIPDGVTNIGKLAFYNCSNLTSINMPDSVTSIGDMVFSNCSSLTSINMPDSVTSIGNYAFYNCSSLTSITIPDGVTRIADLAFWYCSSLTSITIPDSVTSIGDYTFNNCSSLTSINIPDSVTSIGSYAFGDCTNLTNIRIPSKLSVIEPYTFFDCYSLNYVVIPASVTAIRDGAFENCISLYDVQILGEHTEVDEWAFSNCPIDVVESYSGTWKNLSWTLSEDGVLRISGNGGMGQLNRNDAWLSMRAKIRSVIIDDGVTDIGESAFDECVFLENVMIGDTINSINYCAFSDCSCLKSVKIPASVHYIDSYAFAGCSDLFSIMVEGNNIDYASEDGILYSKDKKTLILCPHGKDGTVEIPESVETIAQGAFSNASNINRIVIPASVNNIEKPSEFAGMNVQISIDSANQAYVIRDNVLYNKQMTKLIYCLDRGAAHIDIPESVTEIGAMACYNLYNLSEISLPHGLLSIGDEAFEACYSLQSVVIPDSVTSIGFAAFFDNNSLTSVTLPNGITEIEDETFDCCNLSEIVIPDSVRRVGFYAFANNPSLTRVVLPNNVVSFGGAFENTPFGRLGCGDFNNLLWVISEGGELRIYGSGAMDKLSEYSAWKGTDISAITAIYIGNGITSIGENAFSGCGNITEVHIPQSVTNIGAGAFDNCDDLTDLYIEDLNLFMKVRSSGEGNPFGNVSNIYLNGVLLTEEELSKIYAAETVGSCGSHVIWTFSNGDTLTVFGTGAMDYTWQDGIDRDSVRHVVIEYGVTAIDIDTFFQCENMVDITIPDSVMRIGYEAFSGCIKLTSIEIPDSVTRIEDWAFGGCRGLTDVVIPNGVTSISDKVFFNCSNLRKIYLPDSVRDIGAYVFSGCGNLSEIEIPNGVTSIGEGAFLECSGLKKITIPDGMISIGVGAFLGCVSVKDIFIPTSVKTIGIEAFYACDSLQTVWTDAKAKQWNIGIVCDIVYNATRNDYAFWSNCDRTKENIVIPDRITIIPDNAFYGCRNLKTVVIPDSVVSIGFEAFSGCTGLMSVSIPEGVESIDSGAFFGCSSLSDILIPRSVTSIKKTAVDGLILHCYEGSYAEEWANANGLIYIPEHISMTVEAVAPTCTMEGTTEGEICEVCGAVLTGCEIVPALEHVEVIDAAIEPTCTETGLTEGKHCSVCGEILVAQETVEALGHTEVIDEAIAPTCTETGLTEGKHCSACGEILIAQETVEALGHTEVIDEAIAPTCTETGLTEGKHCSVCDEILVAQETVEALGHTEVIDEAIAPTCTETGLTEGKHCFVCNEVIIEQTKVDELGHAIVHCEAQQPYSVHVGWNAYDYCTRCEYTTYEEIPAPVTIIASGNCGDNVSWLFGEDGTLLISGNGVMMEYDELYNKAPWYEYNSTIKTVVLEEGVESIGKSAFSGCCNLSEIHIPESVANIDESAFSSCSSLKSVNIPGGVTNISKNAFRGCSNLTSVSFPDGLVSINQAAFCECSNLKELRLPEGLEVIGPEAFRNCNSLISIEIPESVKSIGGHAFAWCSNLVSISLPKEMSDMGGYVFMYCDNLLSVDIPSSVASVSEALFYDCDKLKNVTIPDGITSIGNYAFLGCSCLVSISLPESIVSIGEHAFDGCWMEEITLPDNITNIGFNAFGSKTKPSKPSIGKFYCQPGTDTSANIVKAGFMYYLTDNDFCLTEADTRVKVYNYSGNFVSVAIPDGINEWVCDNSISTVLLPATLCETDVFTLNATSVSVPEGVTAMGTLSLSGIQKIFIPASVTDMSGVNVTDGSVPTVYCEMDSEAELWTLMNGFDVVYTDADGWDEECSFTCILSTYPDLDVGETITLSLKDFIIEPMPVGEIVITLEGDEYVTASGMTFTAVKPGDANPQAVFGTHKVTVPTHVYQTPTSMQLEAPLFVPAGETFAVSITETAPTDISGKFTWQQDGGTPVTDTILTHTFTASAEPGSTVITVTAPGGYTKSVTVTVAGSISAPYAGGNNRSAVTGSFIDICVDVDGVTYRNASELYGTVTVPASAAGIIELTADGRIHVIGSGRTAFTVTGLDGKKVSVMVVANQGTDVLTLPAGMVSIEEEAFAGVAAQKAVLPAGCVSIGSRAFASSAVQIVNVPASVTSIADDAFSECNVTVYCPAGSYAESWCAAHYVNCVAE